MATSVDTRALETRVKRMYELVTMEPLRPGGRPAVADIVSERPLPESAVATPTCGPPASAAPLHGTTTATPARATACAAFPCSQQNPGGDRSCPL